MKRLFCAAVLGCLLLAPRPALAQEETKDVVKKLESDLAKLRVQVNDLQSQLQKVKEATAKQGEKTPAMHGWHHGFSWMHFARMHDKMASCQKMQAQAKDKTTSEGKAPHRHWVGGWLGWQGSHWGHHHHAAHWVGHHGWHEWDRSAPISVEQRLDHIMRELAELRRDLHKTK